MDCAIFHSGRLVGNDARENPSWTISCDLREMQRASLLLQKPGLFSAILHCLTDN